MSRRGALLLVGAFLLGSCGRRGKLELPKRDSEGRGAETVPPAPPAPQRRTPRPVGLEAG